MSIAATTPKRATTPKMPSRLSNHNGHLKFAVFSNTLNGSSFTSYFNIKSQNNISTQIVNDRMYSI